MRLIVAGHVPTAPSDRSLFFQDVSLLLQALLGLSIGEEQVNTSSSFFCSASPQTAQTEQAKLDLVCVCFFCRSRDQSIIRHS